MKLEPIREYLLNAGWTPEIAQGGEEVWNAPTALIIVDGEETSMHEQIAIRSGHGAHHIWWAIAYQVRVDATLSKENHQ